MSDLTQQSILSTMEVSLASIYLKSSCTNFLIISSIIYIQLTSLAHCSCDKPGPLVNSPVGESSVTTLACIMNPLKSGLSVPPDSVTQICISRSVFTTSEMKSTEYGNGVSDGDSPPWWRTISVVDPQALRRSPSCWPCTEVVTSNIAS